MKLQALYAHYYIRPRFDALGKGYLFIHPWNIKIFGKNITMGDYANILTTSDRKVRMTVWPQDKTKGKIAIGSYCLICPGVRISSADEIVIEDNCMLAGSVFITDSDWHGTYDRVTTIGRTAPVHLRNNVWLGDRVTVCKGVTIGENSIIGTGAVVVRDVPDNVIAAGNPAQVVRKLDPDEPLIKRQHWFADPDKLKRDIEKLDQENLYGNTFRGWIRSIVKPGMED